MKARQTRAELQAPVAIVLGSGLGRVCEHFASTASVRFSDIPGVGAAGVDGHEGAITRAQVGGTTCLFVQGRRHRYEGDTSAITALVSALRDAGVRDLVLTCAAGCLSPAIGVGELMLVSDVLNLQSCRFPGPAAAGGVGRGVERGLRLDPDLSHRLALAASAAGIRLTRGVLASLTGPTYETPAEIAALQRVGVDGVSMSVVPELHAATTFGIRVAALAHMTNWAAGLGSGTLDHKDVLASGHQAADTVADLIGEFVNAL